MRESVVEAAFVRAVRVRGGRAWKFRSPGMRGVPDRIVTMPARSVFFVELKAPGKVLDAHQANCHALLRHYGAEVYVLDTLERVAAFFDEAPAC